MKPIGRGTRTAIWLATWATAFVVTHLPPSEPPAQPLINDKLLHFTGFTALGVLTAWRHADVLRPISRRLMVFWLLVLIAYGFADEVTQELVRRSFEWFDWVADGIGAAFGISVGAACHYWSIRTQESKPDV
ncbi:MAG: VanZ family protein [Planctomycetota bacterium]